MTTFPNPHLRARRVAAVASLIKLDRQARIAQAGIDAQLQVAGAMRALATSAPLAGSVENEILVEQAGLYELRALEAAADGESHLDSIFEAAALEIGDGLDGGWLLIDDVERAGWPAEFAAP